MYWSKVITVILLLFPSWGLAENDGSKWISTTPTNGGYLSMTFDDATPSQFIAAYPMLRAAGLNATLFVGTELVDAESTNNMSWDQIRVLVDSGWEIGSHTVTHPDLTTQSDLVVVGELAYARDRIYEETRVVPRSFASPYGEYDERTLAHIERYYDLHLRAWGDNQGVNLSGVDPLRIERVNIDESLTAQEVCTMVVGVDEGEWLVLMFHQVRELTGLDERFVSSPLQFETIVACIQAAVVNNNLSVGTVSAGYHFNKEGN